MMEAVLLLLCLLLLVVPCGHYLHGIYSGHFAQRFGWMGRIEGGIARLVGASFDDAMSWQGYVKALMLFLALCFVSVYGLLLYQYALPMNPEGFKVSPSLAFNITMSFITGTNLQTYVPEKTLTILSQNFGITFLQFIAPAADMAVAVALFRAFNANRSETIGNAWQDLTRSIIWVLLPAVVIISLLYVSQGVVQSWGTLSFATMAGGEQSVALGPVASMQAISQFGTNGGGYFAASMAHPLVTPEPWIAFMNRVLIALLPASFFYLFGLMVLDRKQGIALLALITLCVAGLATVAMMQETQLPAALQQADIDPSMGNMEGKELRFGSQNAAMWGVLSTATTNGSASSAFESFSPLSILVMMVPMLFGGILLGGPGMGVINMLSMVIVTVFLASLMIGRSPEYIHKKIGIAEIQRAVLIIVIPAVFLLLAMSLSIYLTENTEQMGFDGVNGYTEMLYALVSAAFNNGSALGGINLNTPYFNLILSVGMFSNSMLCKVIACALAGGIAAKPKTATNRDSLHTSGVTFGILLLLVIIINALSYLPLLMLGPLGMYMEAI